MREDEEPSRRDVPPLVIAVGGMPGNSFRRVPMLPT